jgi:hypothetical protein
MWEQFYSPRFYFGCNVADADTEHQVLDEVGSYGSQLNIVLDAAVVFVQHIPPADLSDDERKRVRALVDLMDRADRASAQFQGKPPQMLPLLLADWLHRPAPGSRTKAGAASAAGGASSNAG